MFVSFYSPNFLIQVNNVGVLKAAKLLSIGFIIAL